MRRALLMATLLGCSGQSLAALAAGGEIRQMFQYLDNPALSAGDLPLWQQRWLGRLDWQPTRHHQLVGELILAWDSGRPGGSSSLEQNEGDLHRLRYRYQGDRWQLAAGRQVWKFGNQRQIGSREGTNVRRRFDGALLTLQGQPLALTAYHGYPVDSRLHGFDDRSERDRHINGLVMEGELAAHQQGHVHLLHYRDRALDERRYAWVMNWRLDGPLALELEGIRQWGHSGPSNINAYWLYGTVSYTARQVTATLGASQASGDSGRHSRFEPLFAKAPYYSAAGIFATSNLREGFAKLTTALDRHSTASLAWRQLWRTSDRDGLYGPGRQTLLAAGADRRDKVAQITTLSAEHTPARHWLMTVSYSYLDSADLMTDAGLASHSEFLELSLDYRF